MAFNPFHAFRKHQKAIFAVMAIVCMFIFVLQFGVGDPLSRLQGWFGGGKQQGPSVTLYGKKVDRKEVQEVAERRMMANTLLALLLAEGMTPPTPEAFGLKTDTMDLGLRAVLDHMKNADLKRDPDASKRDLANLKVLKFEMQNKPGKENEVKFATDLEAALTLQESLAVQLALFRGAPYFGNRGTYDDQLDFLIWKAQADKLGIVLNDAEVRKILKQETGGRDVLPEGAFKSNEKFKKLNAAFVSKYGTVSESDMLAALGDEYRVIMAQEALVGQALTYLPVYFGSHSSDQYVPVTVTPPEFLTYIREQRTGVKVALLPVSVDSFEAKVKDAPQPSEAELKSLFDKYKSEEPKPDRALPAFKQPRRVRVEYVAANAESEFYKAEAKRQLAVSAAQQVVGAVQLYPAGGGAAWAWQAAAPVAQDPIQAAYGQYLSAMYRDIDAGAFLLPPETETASLIAGHVAGLAGNDLSSLPGVVAADLGLQMKRRNLTAFAASSAIMGGGINTLGQPGLALPYMATVQPLSKLEPQLITQAEEAVVHSLIRRNLETVEKEIAKISSDKDAKPDVKAEKVKIYLEKAAKEYGLEHKVMEVPADQYALANDPVLAAFKKGPWEEKPDKPLDPSRRLQFAEQFLRSTGTYKPVFWSPDAGDSESEKEMWNQRFMRNGQAMPADLMARVMSSWLDFWSRSKEPVLFWRAEDDDARDRKFKDAREDVEKAWRRMQARALAEKEMRRLVAAAKEKAGGWPSDDASRQRDVLAWLDSQKAGKAFVLNNVAREVKADSPHAGADRYEPYKPKEDEIKYPPEKFVDTLLTLQKPGDATYLEDKPQSTLYVAVLLARTPPTDAEVAYAFKNTLMDPLWGQFTRKQREAFLRGFVEKLREDAAGPGQVENGKWKLTDWGGKSNQQGLPSED
jgi:hypothetical protein